MTSGRLIKMGFEFVTIGYVFLVVFLFLLKAFKVAPKNNAKRLWKFIFATMPSVYFYGIGFYFIIRHEDIGMDFWPIVAIVHIGFIILMFLGCVTAERITKLTSRGS